MINSRAKSGPNAVTTSIGAHHSPNYVVNNSITYIVNIAKKILRLLHTQSHLPRDVLAGYYAGLTEHSKGKKGAGHMRVG